MATAEAGAVVPYPNWQVPGVQSTPQAIAPLSVGQAKSPELVPPTPPGGGGPQMSTTNDFGSPGRTAFDCANTKAEPSAITDTIKPTNMSLFFLVASNLPFPLGICSHRAPPRRSAMVS